MGNIDEVRGGKLKTMSERARLTQKQVGDHFGIDKSAVSEWERGKGKPTLDKLKPLDALYGGGVLALFDVSQPKRSGDNTVETLRSEVTRLAEVVDRLALQVEALRSGSGPPGRPTVR